MSFEGQIGEPETRVAALRSDDEGSGPVNSLRRERISHGLRAVEHLRTGRRYMAVPGTENQPDTSTSYARRPTVPPGEPNCPGPSNVNIWYERGDGHNQNYCRTLQRLQRE